MFGAQVIEAAARARVGLAAGVALSLLAGPALAQESAQARFASIMDSVFGRGAWRMTGGYRTPERENQLRAQGARTVRPGGLSRHSTGSPDAPGAYDLVVAGMSPYEAAARLRRANAPFARYQPKGSHGTQGPHLHLEPYSFDLLATAPTGFTLAYLTSAWRPRVAQAPADGLLVVQEGASRPMRAKPAPVQASAPELPVSMPAEQEFARLREEAMQDSPEAQLQLGRANAAGTVTPRNLAAAQAWMEAAATNPTATPETQRDALAELTGIKRLLEAERTAQAQGYARLQTSRKR